MNPKANQININLWPPKSRHQCIKAEFQSKPRQTASEARHRPTRDRQEVKSPARLLGLDRPRRRSRSGSITNTRGAAGTNSKRSE